MPTAIPNGGGGYDISSSELIAYNRSTTTPSGGGGSQTSTEQAVDEDVSARVELIAGGWTTTPSVDPLEVLARAAAIQTDVALAIRQWARPGTERRMMEMISSLMSELTSRDRELLELRARLDASPY